MSDKRLDIVITMAGIGSRFREAGYTIPKYRIEAKGKTLFEWSMESLRDYQDMANRYIFIVRKEDKAEEFIYKMSRKLKIPQPCVIGLDYRTDGQATTALLGREAWGRNNGLLIYNIDTYVEAGQMKYGELKGDGFIPCFHGEGDHWSFVQLDSSGKAIEVKEKVRISDNCTLGAYYFSSCGLYEEMYRDYYGKGGNLEKGERYVAPLYNHMIRLGKEVYISLVEKKRVHVLGTPEELKMFLNEE